MKRSLSTLAALMLLCTSWAVFAQTPKRPSTDSKEKSKANIKANDASAFMRLKLEHSQKVLEGVALEDFASIKQHAQKLGSLALDENWQVLQTREYRDYSGEFQQISGRLSKAADEKNLDAAALAYVQLTLNCVNCHKHVRDERDERQ